MKTKIYIGPEYKLLDMFDDEVVQVVSKLSDIEKLSNVFNDYSNSFTIPATPNNNEIFKHYYDYSIDNGFNANLTINAYIEIDTLPFKFGKVLLENVVLKDHRPSTYKITFFGALRQLTDLFGEDTINRLDYAKDENGNETKQFTSLSQFAYDYTGPNFLDSINNPSFKDGNVITPLIAYADRDWNYGTNDATDISGGPESSGSIKDTELRPALRIARILEGIETKYGISFTRDFFGKAVFNNLFMWCDPSLRGFGDYRTLNVHAEPYEIEEAEANGFTIDNAADTIAYTSVAGNRSVLLYIVPEADYFDVNYRIAIYDNDILVFESDAVKGINEFEYNKNGTHILSYKIKSDATLRYSSTFILFAPDWTNYIQIFNIYPPGGLTCLGGINFADILPRMKVVDFVQGIMKQFKLMIRPISENQFYVDTLDGYYSRGNFLNISDYVNHEQVDIERPMIYRNLKFLYEKTNNVLGKKFRETNDPRDEIGYGDLRFEYAGIRNTEELTVKLPFENMLFERLTTQDGEFGPNSLTNIIIGQSVQLGDDNITLTPNDSKPILFFNNGLAIAASHPFKVWFSPTDEYSTVSYPYIIGNTNDAILSQVTDTINFGSEIDPWHLSQIENSLYLNYWNNWVETIYSLRQRKFTYTSSNLPARYIQELSLNDRIIIGNNRYKINDYSIDITTGKAKFVLFNDIFDYAEPQPFATITTITTNAGTKYYGIPINTDGYWHVSLLDEGDGTDWVEVLTPSGTGSTEIVIRVLEKASQMPPEVYNSRLMTINIWQGEGYVSGHAVELTQIGLD